MPRAAKISSKSIDDVIHKSEQKDKKAHELKEKRKQDEILHLKKLHDEKQAEFEKH